MLSVRALLRSLVGGLAARSPLLHFIILKPHANCRKLRALRPVNLSLKFFIIFCFPQREVLPLGISRNKNKKDVAICLLKLGGLSLGFGGGSLENIAFFPI